MVAFAEHPDQWDVLAAQAVEEVMRHRPAVPAIFRSAVEDVEATRDAPQLAFGGGMHFCLGAWVARAGIFGPEALPRRLEPR
jgi:cytochrome P450